jgi:drug/metabolite transporter (DMT)-like permease
MRLVTTASVSATITKGYLICLTGTVIWSTTGILIRYLTQTYHLPPLVLAIWRDLFVSLGLAVGLALLNFRLLKIAGSQVWFLILYGFIVSLFNSMWTFSVALNGAAVATVLAYSAPAFTALLGWRLFGERLGWFKAGVILASILGCALVSGA